MQAAVVNNKSGGRKLASRLQRLGTETAYGVAAEARELAAKGKTIYPFHIGKFDHIFCCFASLNIMIARKSDFLAFSFMNEE